ncbi:MAG: hypothetical protein K8L97_06710 [Anaerolineae bacterium]|nr:hypothetical protein [Anaerolineae bacterium]
MRTWFTSRNGVITLTILIALIAGLVLLSAIATHGLSTRTIAASLLVLCFVVFTFGGVLYAGRAFLKWQIDENSFHLIWERGFVIGGILATLLGLALLEDMLRTAGDSFLSRLGLVTYLSGAVVALTAETAYVAKRDWIYPQIVLYVILAFLAQAAFGAALLQTGLVAAWVGWVTILWNLVWLIGLLIFNPRNVYFPVLHHVAPLIIGIALLVSG